MKKIAIILDEMSIGGIPKACVDFANQLKEYCEVVILMKNMDGELIKGLAKDISIKIIQTPSFKETIKKQIHNHKYIELVKYISQYFYHTRLKNRWVKANVLTAKNYGEYEADYYDCAIAYHGMSISQLLTTLYGVNAKKKIAWIHGDHPFEGIHRQDIRDVYSKFDKIYCVSPSVCDRFLEDFTGLDEKVDSYKNLLNVEKIRGLAREKTDEEANDTYVKIVTVGRVSQEKGQEMIPEIIAKLKEREITVRWYIIGDGNDLERVKKLSEKWNVYESIKFLGSKTNPYPYIKMCDIYVQPSYTEGYCLTVCEAAILGKAIVLTEIAAAEILEDEKTGIVVKTCVDSLANGIERLIKEPTLKRKIEDNLLEVDLSNSQEIVKLLKFI